MERDSLQLVLVSFETVFSQPSFRSFVFLLEGWIVAGVRGMTSTALAARGAFPKHFASYYRFFSEGAWCPDALGIALLEFVLPFAPRGPLVVAVDDTLARNTGKRIWGANMHHSASGGQGPACLAAQCPGRRPQLGRPRRNHPRPAGAALRGRAGPVAFVSQPKRRAREKRVGASANASVRERLRPGRIAPGPSWRSKCFMCCETPWQMGVNCALWATAPTAANRSRGACLRTPCASVGCL
jgi:hypothetical protein